MKKSIFIHIDCMCTNEELIEVVTNALYNRGHIVDISVKELEE